MGFFEKSLEIAANRMVKDVGRLQNLRIDKEKRSCSAAMLLAGEVTPIQIKVGKYEAVTDGDTVTLQLRNVTCSREWIEKLAARLESQMNIELPSGIVSVLRLAKVI